MVVTLAGILIEVKPEFSKALLPMLRRFDELANLKVVIKLLA